MWAKTPAAGVYSLECYAAFESDSPARDVGSAKRVRARDPSSSAISTRATGLRCDQDLVGRECRQRIRDCKQRIAVARTTLGVNSALFQAVGDDGGAFLGSAACAVFVRQPAPEPGVQRRRHDEHPGARQVRRNHGVEGDDEHVPLASSVARTPFGLLGLRVIDQRVHFVSPFQRR